MRIKAYVDHYWKDIFGIRLERDDNWELVTLDENTGIYEVFFTFSEARSVVDALLPILAADKNALVAEARARVEGENAEKERREAEHQRLVDEQFDALESALGDALTRNVRHYLEQARISAKRREEY